MKTDIKFIQVNTIINIINSCETQKQLFSCKNIMTNYINDIKIKGVVNYDDVKSCLQKKYDERCETLKYKVIIKETKKKRTKKLELV